MAKTTLGELVDSVSITHKFDKSKLIFLNTSDVLEGKILTNQYMEVSQLKGQAKKTIQNDDILFSEIRPKNKRYAYVNVTNPSDYVVSTKLMVLRNKSDNVLTKYLYYFLTYDGTLDYLQMRAENRIGSFPQITFDLVKILELNIPDISTQTKVVKVISDIDEKIDINKKIIQSLEELALTTYNYWFVQFDFPNEKGLPYRSSGGGMYWCDELKRNIPLGWQVGSLLDIAEYQNGIACQKFPPENLDTLRVIKIREMSEGFSADSDLVRLNVPQKIVINDGDVLFSWSASLDVIIWAGGKGALNQHIFKVTSNSHPKSYFYFELINYLSHFKMMAENRKTTMGHITQEHLEQSRITIPPQDLILEMDKLLSPNLEKIVALKKEIQKLSELRAWLLPKLMNDKLLID